VLRVSFYKAVVSFVRAYAAISQDLEAAGYSAPDIDRLQDEVAFFTEVRAAIKRHSGEELDIKPYEADMRHLINTYIQADPASNLGGVDRYSLVELIIETGIHDAIAQKLNQKGKLSKNAVAEGIINNVRKTIIRERLTDPRFYEKLSRLLEDLISDWRKGVASYEEFLERAESLIRKMRAGHATEDVPAALVGNQPAIVIYNNLPQILAQTQQPTLMQDDEPEYADSNISLALAIDQAMREEAPAGWRGDDARERQVLNALFPILNRNREATQAVFELIKNQAGYP